MTSAQATCDEILRGRLRLWQPSLGYRFNVDSLLLVDFAAQGTQVARVVDLCAGVGVIGLALAVRWPEARVTLAELQTEMAGLARRNIEENRLAERADLVQTDLANRAAARAALPGASFDLALASPPYFSPSAGPPVSLEGEAIARHELRIDIATLAQEMRRLLVPGGRSLVVFPSERLVALLAAFAGARLQPLRLRFVYPRPGSTASRVLVEAQKGSRGPLVVEPPLLVRDEKGHYTEEARRALGD